MEAATAFDTYSVTTASFLKKMMAAGFTTAIRYYRNKPASGNGALTITELLILKSEGFDIVAVFEVETIKPHIGQFTHDLGKQAATTAYKYAANEIKQPRNSAIYFAVDFNPTKGQIESSIVDYFKGVNEAMASLAPDGGAGYDIGVYGSGQTCQTLLDRKLVTYTWLSNSSSFLGTAAFDTSGKWNLKQQTPTTLAELSVDRNFIGAAGCGAFNYRVITESKMRGMGPEP